MRVMALQQVEGLVGWPVEAGPEFVHGATPMLKVPCQRPAIMSTLKHPYTQTSFAP